jgi:hypothetical protein
VCDPGLILGLVSGIASAAGQAETARKNQDMVIAQTKMEHATQAREMIIEANASNKEGYAAKQEADQTKSFVKTMGEGMRGSTAGERSAEQDRQGALSIANAKDRADAAGANYQMAGKHSQIGAQNRINTLEPNPMAMFANIVGSGLSNYGAFG